MSEKILSRKWDVWQERLGWEGSSHLLWKMYPLSKVDDCTAVLSLVIRWLGMSRMCWSIWSDKGLYLCHSKWRRPRRGCQAMGQEGAGRARLLQIWEINPGVQGRNWLFCARGLLTTSDTVSELINERLIVCRVKRLHVQSPNSKDPPPAGDKHLILGGV